jgi:hypothetical protein
VLVPKNSPLLVAEEQRLLQIVDTTVRQGHGPASCLIARLTDGRVKIVSISAGQVPETALLSLTHRYGPVAAAYAIEPGANASCRTRVRNLLNRRSWTRHAGGWQAEERLDQSRRASGLSRNAAIFAGSLGIKIGALPKVDVIASPAGVFN